MLYLYVFTCVVFVSMCILGIRSGLVTSLLGVRSTIEDFSSLAIGIALAGYYAGFLVGGRTIGAMLAHVGHVRVFAGLASLASAAALLHALYLNPVAWLVLRLLSGFCMSSIFITAESWLNEVADNRNRGRVLSIYMVMGMGGATFGQLLIGVDNPGGFGLFILVSVLFSLSLVPLSLTRTNPPRIRQRYKADIAAVYRSAPLATVGATPVGLTSAQVGWMMGALLFGAMANHPARTPVGSIPPPAGHPSGRHGVHPGGSPHVQRHRRAGASHGRHDALRAVTFPVYALSMGHMNDLLDVDRLIPGATAMVTFRGAGAIPGPVLTAGVMMMTLMGPDGMWLALAVFDGLFVIYIIRRFLARHHQHWDGTV